MAKWLQVWKLKECTLIKIVKIEMVFDMSLKKRNEEGISEWGTKTLAIYKVEGHDI